MADRMGLDYGARGEAVTEHAKTPREQALESEMARLEADARKSEAYAKRVEGERDTMRTERDRAQAEVVRLKAEVWRMKEARVSGDIDVVVLSRTVERTADLDLTTKEGREAAEVILAEEFRRVRRVRDLFPQRD